jgi:hypothetical protein
MPPGTKNEFYEPIRLSASVILVTAFCTPLHRPHPMT